MGVFLKKNNYLCLIIKIKILKKMTKTQIEEGNRILFDLKKIEESLEQCNRLLDNEPILDRSIDVFLGKARIQLNGVKEEFIIELANVIKNYSEKQKELLENQLSIL